MRTPSSALPAWPNGLVEGLLVKVLGRPFATAFFAAGFFAFSFTTFFNAALDLGLTFVLAFTFLLFAIVASSKEFNRCGRLFLANRALRVEFADVAAFG